MRLFAAVPLPPDIRESVSRIQRRLQGALADVKWVAADRYHLTMKFLGDVPDDRLPAVSDALERAACGNGPFPVSLSGVGAFPDTRRPRVVWLGVAEGAPELTALAGRIDEEFSLLGFERETRPFVCHLTLGRVRSRQNVDALVRRIGAASESAAGRFEAECVELMKSTLRPQGAEHECLRTIRL